MADPSVGSGDRLLSKAAHNHAPARLAVRVKLCESSLLRAIRDFFLEAASRALNGELTGIPIHSLCPAHEAMYKERVADCHPFSNRRINIANRHKRAGAGCRLLGDPNPERSSEGTDSWRQRPRETGVPPCTKSRPAWRPMQPATCREGSIWCWPVCPPPTCSRGTSNGAVSDPLFATD